ncbi:MAG TPA: hypothetical protein ENK02_02590, partial [Planctomycetes bacterium]|nr:hypothetical protein [Planctomycetota bacterium]
MKMQAFLRGEGVQAGEEGRSWKFLCGLALVLLLGIWGYRASTPFSRVEGIADYIGNENGRIAANYLRYGYAETRGAQIRNLEPSPKKDWVHYQMHPATLDLLTSLVLRVTGSFSPLVLRILPFFAALAAFLLLFQLAKEVAVPPFASLTLFLLFPMTGVHGINLSYEPFCLAFLLGIVLLYLRGRRFALLPLFFLGGLFDYPVLYLAPFLALHELSRPRDSVEALPWLKMRLLFFLSLFLVSLASIGTHLLHVLWSMGDLRGGAGDSWGHYLLQVLAGKGWMPGLGAFFARQWEMFRFGYTPLVFGLAILATLGFRKRLTLPSLAFLFVGGLHTLVFRGHAMLHDFWLVYFSPFLALICARLLLGLPRWAGIGILCGVGVMGMRTTLRVWAERAAPPVRIMGKELATLVPGEAILHGFATPAPWALETYRGHPVLDGLMILQDPGGLAKALDRMATYGYLHRPQWAVLAQSRLQPGWKKIFESYFPHARRERREGKTDRYDLYEFGSVFFEPGSFPKFAEL